MVGAVSGALQEVIDGCMYPAPCSIRSFANTSSVAAKVVRVVQDP